MFDATYRPRRISEVIGQTHVKRALSKLLRNYSTNGEFPRCILFHGPWGTGKTTLARVLFTYVACEKGPLQACLECEPCLLSLRGANPDYWEVDAVSNSSVEDVPKFKEWCQYKTRYRRKFLVLDEAHRLSDKAWDALLKIMEEGQENVTWVFCTTESEKIPGTVISRAKGDFKLYKLTPQEIQTVLTGIMEKEKIRFENPDGLMVIIRKADGHARDALKYLEQVTMCAAIAEDGFKVVDNEAMSELIDYNEAERADRFLQAAFSGNRDALYDEIAGAHAVAEDFCRSVIEIVRHELFLHSVLAEQFKYPQVHVRDLVRFSAMLEDNLGRLLFGESLTTLFIGYERWKLGDFYEIEDFKKKRTYK